jgi:hypothetical protein
MLQALMPNASNYMLFFFFFCEDTPRLFALFAVMWTKAQPRFDCEQSHAEIAA